MSAEYLAEMTQAVGTTTRHFRFKIAQVFFLKPAKKSRRGLSLSARQSDRKTWRADVLGIALTVSAAPRLPTRGKLGAVQAFSTKLTGKTRADET